MLIQGSLDIWVIYDNPQDYVGKFVARKFKGEVPTDTVIVGETLIAVQEQLPLGLTRLKRDLLDDPVIVEVWI